MKPVRSGFKLAGPDLKAGDVVFYIFDKVECSGRVKWLTGSVHERVGVEWDLPSGGGESDMLRSDLYVPWNGLDEMLNLL